MDNVDIRLLCEALKEMYRANDLLESILASDMWYRFKVVVVLPNTRPVRVEFAGSVSWYDCEGIGALNSAIGGIMYKLSLEILMSDENRCMLAQAYPRYFEERRES